MHSDAPITPLNPLFTAWCAVQRETASGRVLGEGERLAVDDAHAITLGAAYTLRMDHLVGSIEIGKFADFAVLDDDPSVCAPARLKADVWGTVLGRARVPVAAMSAQATPSCPPGLRSRRSTSTARGDRRLVNDFGAVNIDAPCGRAGDA